MLPAILVFVIAALVGTLLVGIYKYQLISQKKIAVSKVFLEYADRKELTKHEGVLLTAIAKVAGLKKRESIFNLSNVFDRSASLMVQERLVKMGTKPGNQLRVQLALLREKLGFKRQNSYNTNIPVTTDKLSSSHIPDGKKLLLIPLGKREGNPVEATILENHSRKMILKTAEPLAAGPSDLWCVRYTEGALVWEFDTTASKCEGDNITLNREKDIRFIDRRRFARIPVKKPGFIAHWTFHELAGNQDRPSQPLELVPATIVELSGPGLRIETSIGAQIGDEMFVVFELYEANEEYATEFISEFEKPGARIIACVGKTRNIRQSENGYSIAVELTELSDTDFNELVHATNLASLNCMEIEQYQQA